MFSRRSFFGRAVGAVLGALGIGTVASSAELTKGPYKRIIDIATYKEIDDVCEAIDAFVSYTLAPYKFLIGAEPNFTQSWHEVETALKSQLRCTGTGLILKVCVNERCQRPITISILPTALCFAGTDDVGGYYDLIYREGYRVGRSYRIKAENIHCVRLPNPLLGKA